MFMCPCREAAETIALLESFLEGLASDSSGALRAVCADTSLEFFVCSAKHIPQAGGRSAGSNVNAASLLRRLMDQLSQPAASRRWDGHFGCILILI